MVFAKHRYVLCRKENIAVAAAPPYGHFTWFSLNYFPLVFYFLFRSFRSSKKQRTNNVFLLNLCIPNPTNSIVCTQSSIKNGNAIDRCGQMLFTNNYEIRKSMVHHRVSISIEHDDDDKSISSIQPRRLWIFRSNMESDTFFVLSNFFSRRTPETQNIWSRTLNLFEVDTQFTSAVKVCLT